jgi:hypothetical protein
MRNTLARRLVLAGTFAFAIGCGHDNSVLPTNAQIGTDSLLPVEMKYGDLRWPYKLVITPAPVPAMAPGATVKLSAKVTDPAAKVLNATVIWTSTNAAVATVGTDGTVTAKAAGTAVVRGNSLAVATVKDSAVIVVTGTPTAPAPATVKTVTVALSNTSIATATNSQGTATSKDSLGQAMTGRTITWMSLSPTVASVNASTGVITGVAPGTSTITATDGSVTGSATITVKAPTPTTPVGSEVLANLPQVFMNTTMPAAPAAGGKVISVAAGGNLQAAINSALPGDVIELANGATFSGNFTLPNKVTSSTNWIVIRPANMSGVPAAGSRMTPSQAAAANLPKVVSISNQGAFNTDFGAHHFRLVALEVTVPATINNTGLIRLGTSYEATVAQLPHDLVLDRMYIHGTASGNNRRCVSLNGASTAVIDSYISDCHEYNVDAQAIAGWSGPGPFKIVNNYIEGSSENMNWGGGDPLIQGLIPSDIEIRRNHFFKPTSWKGKWMVKNLLEIKNAQRVLIEGNIFENNWQDGQGGSAIVLKSVNQGGGCPWCVAKDITFRYNLIKNTGSGFALTGHDVGAQSIMTRVTITDNVVTGIDVRPQWDGDGRGFLINNDPIDLVITHNTVPDPTNMAIVFGGPTTELPTRLVIRDNLMGGGQYGVKGPGLATNTALAMFMPGGWRGNVLMLAPGNTSGYPTGTLFASTLAALGFVNSSALDFHLSASSLFRLKATDGRDPGADVNAVNSAIAGVIVP